MEDFNKQMEQLDWSDKAVLDKPFDKDAWLEQLAEDIERNSWTEEGSKEGDYITIQSLQEVLEYYFPKIKLTQHDRTSTNTGKHTPELAPDIAATLRQSKDEDDTGADFTNMQVVSG